MKRLWTPIILLCLLLCTVFLAGCQNGTVTDESGDQQEVEYSYTEYPLERNGIDLHLDRIVIDGTDPEKNILLIHGVTYSSHEFDVDFEDRSLVRKLAREGYGVWRLDIAGFGRSEEVEDGFLPNSDYAAEDIKAAAEKITETTEQKKIDLFGWSWGTVTAGRFTAAHPELVNRLVLYAPILSGIGEHEVEEPFHHNTWEHAAEDLQRREDGSIDYSIIDPVFVEMWCSSCWHYDGDTSPNGGRRDLCVDGSQVLVDLTKIEVPTLVICGDNDPYLNYDLVDSCLDNLPKGSAYEKIEGGSHMVFVETPYYSDFQKRLMQFLNE